MALPTANEQILINEWNNYLYSMISISDLTPKEQEKIRNQIKDIAKILTILSYLKNISSYMKKIEEVIKKEFDAENQKRPDGEKIILPKPEEIQLFQFEKFKTAYLSDPETSKNYAKIKNGILIRVFNQLLKSFSINETHVVSCIGVADSKSLVDLLKTGTLFIERGTGVIGQHGKYPHWLLAIMIGMVINEYKSDWSIHLTLPEYLEVAASLSLQKNSANESSSLLWDIIFDMNYGRLTNTADPFSKTLGPKLLPSKLEFYSLTDKDIENSSEHFCPVFPFHITSLFSWVDMWPTTARLYLLETNKQMNTKTKTLQQYFGSKELDAQYRLYKPRAPKSPKEHLEWQKATLIDTANVGVFTTASQLALLLKKSFPNEIKESIPELLKQNPLIFYKTYKPYIDKLSPTEKVENENEASFCGKHSKITTTVYVSNPPIYWHRGMGGVIIKKEVKECIVDLPKETPTFNKS